MSGVNLAASQIGGAIAPLLVLPIQMRYGWRMSFYVFGAVGLVWAAAWYCWFRDSPGEMPGGQPADCNRAVGDPPVGPRRVPVARGRAVVVGLGAARRGLLLHLRLQLLPDVVPHVPREGPRLQRGQPVAVDAAVPGGGGANLAGGAASDALMRRFGRGVGRRLLGSVSLAAAAAFTLAAMVTQHHRLTVVLLALAYGAITFQQSSVFGVCLDIGGPRAGAMVGLMNTVAQAGGLVGSVAYGYIVAQPQLRRAVRADGGGVVHRHAVLAAD